MEGYGMNGETVISIPRSEYRGLIENQMRLRLLIGYIDGEIEREEKDGIAGRTVCIETAVYDMITGIDDEPED